MVCHKNTLVNSFKKWHFATPIYKNKIRQRHFIKHSPDPKQFSFLPIFVLVFTTFLHFSFSFKTASRSDFSYFTIEVLGILSATPQLISLRFRL